MSLEVNDFASNSMWHAYRERVEQELYKELQKMAEPMLRKAAAEAAKALEGAISRHQDHLSGKLISVIDLKINGKQEPLR